MLGRVVLRSTPGAMVFVLIVLLATFAGNIAVDLYHVVLWYLAIGTIALAQIRLGFLCGVTGMIAAFLASRIVIGWDWSAPWGTIAWGSAVSLAMIVLASAWIATRDGRARASQPM